MAGAHIDTQRVSLIKLADFFVFTPLDHDICALEKLTGFLESRCVVSNNAENMNPLLSQCANDFLDCIDHL